MAGFPQAAYGLDPAEDFFDPFAFALTQLVPRMARGALIKILVGLRAKCGVTRCSRISCTSSLRS
jgi:hypothetical protein